MAPILRPIERVSSIAISQHRSVSGEGACDLAAVQPAVMPALPCTPRATGHSFVTLLVTAMDMRLAAIHNICNRWSYVVMRTGTPQYEKLDAALLFVRGCHPAVRLPTPGIGPSLFFFILVEQLTATF
ncbi:hypothetical protein PSPO01_04568 [Paraphaeosphaeria sporulosa]